MNKYNERGERHGYCYDIWLIGYFLNDKQIGFFKAIFKDKNKLKTFYI
jgi:hypothetical protein